MALTTEPDRTVPQLRPKRRRRWLWVTLAILLVLILGSFSGMVAYEPLREGSTSGARGPSRIERLEGVNEFPTIVIYESGASLELEFTVRNDGLVGVTITDVVRPMLRQFGLGLYEIREVRRGVRGRCCVEMEPFAPFTLAPNEERIIQLRGVLRGCGEFAPGTSESWDAYEVSYRILGIPRTTRVTTSHPVRIEIPPDYRCPEQRRTPTS